MIQKELNIFYLTKIKWQNCFSFLLPKKHLQFPPNVLFTLCANTWIIQMLICILFGVWDLDSIV